MNVNIETVSETKKKISIEIPEERIQKEFNKLYGELRTKAHIPGFRKGKVPKSVLKMRMGNDIAMQIGVDLIEEFYPEAIKKIDDEIIGQPEFGEWKVEEGKAFTFDVTIEILPPIELKDYKGMEVPRGEVDITDEMIEDGLKRIQEGNATFEVVNDRPSEEGDRIYGRVSLSIDEDEVAGWSGRHIEVDVGDGKFFPDTDVEKHFVGVEAGKETTFTIEFADDYGYYQDFQGKTVVFTLATSDVKKKVMPEIGDDLAKDLGLDNLEDLQKMVRTDLEQNQQKSIDEAFENAIFEAINTRNDVPAPDAMVDNEAEHIFKNYFSYQGEMSADNKAKLMESMKPMAAMRVRQQLILQRIVELEEIEVTDDDVEESFKEMAESTNEDIDKIKSQWEEENMIPQLKKQMARSKAMTWLKENVKPVELVIETPEAPASDDSDADADEQDANNE